MVEAVGVGEVGELIIRGPQVMQGYFSHKHEVEKVIFDGWLYTGDLARMDKDGYFYIVGRRKNMIIRSGLKIYPNEISLEPLYKYENFSKYFI